MYIIAEGAFAKCVDREVPVINREVTPPMQIGVGTVVDENGGISIRLFDPHHALFNRGDLSLHAYDVQCGVCNSCSCHTPNALFGQCVR